MRDCADILPFPQKGAESDQDLDERTRLHQAKFIITICGSAMLEG